MDISEIKDLINAISNSKIDIFDYGFTKTCSTRCFS